MQPNSSTRSPATLAISAEQRPRMRVLRFYELKDRTTATISTGLTDNLITPTASNVAFIEDIYDNTNKRWLDRVATRAIRRRDSVELGVPVDAGRHPGTLVRLGTTVDRRIEQSHQLLRSTTIAPPCPPPTHSVASPSATSRRAISDSSVRTSRPPVAPTGLCR